MRSVTFYVLFATALTLVALAWAKTQGILLIDIEKPIDLASLLLISATLVVTGVGVVAALLAIFGYAEIKRVAIEEARKQADMTAREVATAVAARVAREAVSVGTTTEEAEGIARAAGDDGGGNAAG